MSNAAEVIRAETLVRLRAAAAALFASRPELQSLTMLVAQFWCDEAEDQTHAMFLASPREVPLWPDGAPGEYENFGVPGDEDVGGVELDDDELVEGFAAYCPEDGSQEEPNSHNYRPWAIARRTLDGVEVEVVGKLYRAHEDAVEADLPELELDARALLLLAEIAGDPSDDDRRRVLADHLQELGDPRGELLALAVASNPEVKPRHDALLARFGRTWLGPLASIATDVRYDRGLPCHVELELDPEALAWFATTATLPTLRSLHLHGDELATTLATLATARWWPQLAAVVVDEPELDAIATWADRRRPLRLSRLALRVGADGPDWELGFTDAGIDLAQMSWEPSASLAGLAPLLACLPPIPIALVRSRHWDPDRAIIDAIVGDGSRELVIR